MSRATEVRCWREEGGRTSDTCQHWTFWSLASFVGFSLPCSLWGRVGGKGCIFFLFYHLSTHPQWPRLPNSVSLVNKNLQFSGAVLSWVLRRRSSCTGTQAPVNNL